MKILRWTLTGLLAAMTIVLAAGTLIEQSQGTAFAASRVYHAWWFFLLWTVVAGCSLVAIWRMRLWRRMGIALLHGALLVILVGAASSHLTGKEGTLYLRRNIPVSCYETKGAMLAEPLPFKTMTLDSFVVRHYPGTEFPEDFESHLSLVGHDGKRSHAVVSMNHILQADGYRFYQTSFQNNDSILSVNYDPWGTPITYFGYALLALGILMTLADGRETFRQLLRSPWLKKSALTFATLLAVNGLQARSVPTIPKEKAESLAAMPVVYNSRIAPFNTAARDFCLKIYGKESYKGLTPEQVVYGWMKRPDAWKDEKMMLVKDKQLREKFGFTDKHIAFKDLFDAQGNYLLSLQQSFSMPSASLRQLDEKVGLVLRLTNGDLIKPAKNVQIDHRKIEAELVYNRLHTVRTLFMLHLTVGLVSFVLLMAPAFRGRQRLFQGIRILAFASFAIMTITYALRWYISGRIPLGNGYETMLFLSICMMAVTLLLQNRLALIVPFGFLLSGLTLLVAHIGEMDPQITPLVPVLQSPLLSIHVSVVMMAYALLAFTMLSGLFALANHYLGRHEEVEQLTVLSRLLLYPAVFLLAIGIFLGAVWANISWGNYWSWDPKEVWALITMLVYALPLHRTVFLAPHHARNYHLYMIMAFLTVLMTYFGVNYFLGGMHSYA